MQAEDRAHRIGQPSSVNVYFLHVKQSVDDLMWNLIQNKLDNVGQVCCSVFTQSDPPSQRDLDQSCCNCKENLSVSICQESCNGRQLSSIASIWPLFT